MTASSASSGAGARLRVLHFAASFVQLALLLGAIRLLRLEESFGLVAITPLILVGFCVHAWLPAALKLPFFAALSLAAFFVVLGPTRGAILTGISLALLGICHLPVRIALRALLLVAAGALLAALRTGWIRTSWAAAVVPVVASMFMFRSIVYLYDLSADRRAGRPADPRGNSLWMRLSYFFLLPNACFPLFPVVDFQTLRRTYYEEPAQRIHQRGLEWILRGIVHLLLYRAVYAYLTPTAEEIQDLAGVGLFVVSSYLLYLRISGHFHLIVGLLHLFGFHLPETNHDWLLASSFTDCWRRINVYWTELMKKIVYYPAFVRLRRRGEGGLVFAMVGAGALTFLATWVLHAYQWFWLQGSLPLATDGLFWGLAGALALVNMVWESQRPRARALGRAVPSWSAALRRALGTLGIFCLIALIWSLWCSSSFVEWRAILARADDGPRRQWLLLLGVAAAVVLVGAAAQRLSAAQRLDRLVADFPRRVALNTAGALLVLLLGYRPVQAALGPGVVPALAPITQDFLNRRDWERLVGGYYDRLIDREGFGGRVWEHDRIDPNDPGTFLESAVAAIVDTPQLFELVPSRREVVLGSVLETNRWGMRDQDYALEKPKDTVRIAILGTCYEMGLGVNNDEVWEALTEERLNRELSPRTARRYEILNFSVSAYTLLHQLSLLRDKVAQFDPDVIVLSNHFGSSVRYMIDMATRDLPWPAGLAAIFEHAGVERGMDAATIRRRVSPLRDWIDQWALRELAAECRQSGAVFVLLNVPSVETSRAFVDDWIPRRVEQLHEMTRDIECEHLDIGAAFAGQSYEAVAIPRLEHCPSVLGHRLMGARFYDELLRLPLILGAH